MPSAVKSLLPLPKIDYTIFTDASPHGWGAHDEEKDINGKWKFPSDNIHISILELKAVKNALLKFYLDTILIIFELCPITIQRSPISINKGVPKVDPVIH